MHCPGASGEAELILNTKEQCKYLGHKQEDTGQLASPLLQLPDVPLQF